MIRNFFILGAFLGAVGFIKIVSTDNEWILPENELMNPYEEKVEPSKLRNDTFYCYHFTWMGGEFNNRTFKNIRNKTCNQYFKDKKTLCINPMVATFNGGEPDLDYIKEYHPIEATCRLPQDQVCVKYTVYYNGITSYETRYCSRVKVEFESPMLSGCVQEKRGSQLIEVCACRSERGPNGICNSAINFHGVPILIWMLLLRVMFLL